MGLKYFFTLLIFNKMLSFWGMLFAVCCVAFLIEAFNHRKIPVWLAGVVALYITVCLVNVYSLKELPEYMVEYRPLREQEILARYLLSVVFWCIGIFTGIEVFWGRPWARKLLLALCVGNLCILPWKYPLAVAKYHANFTFLADDPQKLAIEPSDLLTIYRTADIVLTLALIFCLVRPKHKKFFISAQNSP